MFDLNVLFQRKCINIGNKYFSWALKTLLWNNEILRVTVRFIESFLCESLFSQSAFVNRPALGILPPENFADKLIESLLSVSVVELEETCDIWLQHMSLWIIAHIINKCTLLHIGRKWPAKCWVLWMTLSSTSDCPQRDDASANHGLWVLLQWECFQEHVYLVQSEWTFLSLLLHRLDVSALCTLAVILVVFWQ